MGPHVEFSSCPFRTLYIIHLAKPTEMADKYHEKALRNHLASDTSLLQFTEHD